jgi:putative ferrous iron transport protein C
MILTDLQTYLAEHHRVALIDLENHFHMSGDALRGMLQKLVRKGRVKKLETSQKCGHCNDCEPDCLEFYQWLGKDH